MYKPNLQNTNLGDKFSDFWLGTNNSGVKDVLNQMELAKWTANINYDLQEAVNTNKYNWNKEGMIKAGINPLISSSNLGAVSQSSNIQQPTFSLNNSFGALAGGGGR